MSFGFQQKKRLKTSRHQISDLRSGAGAARALDYDNLIYGDLTPFGIEKESFQRFGDDLSELLLSYISFEDKFRFECVSKQFQRLIFNKQTEVTVNSRMFYGNSIGGHIPVFKTESFESVLKKCPKIKSIRIDYGLQSMNNQDQLKIYRLIADNLRFLNRIDLRLKLNDEIREQFLSKVGPQLKDIVFFGFSEQWTRSVLKMCPNLCRFHCYSGNLGLIFENNQIFLKKLKSFSMNYSSEDIQRFEVFVENYKNTLESINIEVRKEKPKEFFSQLLKLKELKCLTITHKFPINVSFYDYFKRVATNLTKLDLDLNFSDCSQFQQIYGSINRFKQLKTLRIKSNFNVNPIVIREPPKECKHLMHLSFDDCFQISDEFFDSIDTYFPKLQYIYCENADITQNTLKCLSKLKLKSVCFESNSRFISITESVLLDFIEKSPKLKIFVMNNKAIEMHLRCESIRNGVNIDSCIAFKDNNFRQLFDKLKEGSVVITFKEIFYPNSQIPNQSIDPLF